MPRTPAEIAFRLKQEIVNARLLLLPPSPRLTAAWPLRELPDPAAVCESLRGSAFEADILRIAGDVLAHRFPVLGYTLETGPEIDWRRDYVHGISSAPAYFRFVPYLDFARAGDHKIVWELNRHQHLVALAMAWRFTGRAEFLEEIRRQLTSWLRANPFMRGINWTSALEVAFRAMSWMWIYHLAGDSLGELRSDFLPALYRHACYLEPNLSWYFSPNTHLLGEAVALHAIAALFPSFPRSERWRRSAHDAVLRQMETQVREDGTHFEQSSYYHVYALDMFLFHAVLADVPESYRRKLVRMADYLDALLGTPRRLPFIGDDDGGRWFHPYGDRQEFGRATLTTCTRLLASHFWPWEPSDAHEQAAWWIDGGAPAAASALENRTSRIFRDSGVAVMRAGPAELIVDTGPFGPWSGGHSHSDTLSIVARLGSEDILVDAGTYTYISEPEARDWFRGSAAHNTICIDGAGPVQPSGPFGWAEKPEVELLRWESGTECDRLDAVVRARSFTHRRQISFFKDQRIAFIADEVSAPAGDHLIERFWHLGSSRHASRLLFSPGDEPVLEEGGEHGWRSPMFGVKTPAPVLVLRARRSLPARFWAVLDLSPAPHGLIEVSGDECRYSGVTARW